MVRKMNVISLYVFAYFFGGHAAALEQHYLFEEIFYWYFTWYFSYPSAWAEAPHVTIMLSQVCRNVVNVVKHHGYGLG